MSEAATSAHELRTHHRIAASSNNMLRGQRRNEADQVRRQDDRKATLEVGLEIPT